MFNPFKKNKKKEKVRKHGNLPPKVLRIIRKCAKQGYTNGEIADEIEKSGLLDHRVAEPTISSRVATSGLKFVRQREKKAKAKREMKERMTRQVKEIPKEEVKEIEEGMKPHPIPSGVTEPTPVITEIPTPAIPVIPLGSKGNLKPTQLAAIGWKQSQKIKEQEQLLKEKDNQIEEVQRKHDAMEKKFEELDAQPRPIKKKGYVKIKDLYDPKKSGMTKWEANERHVAQRKKAHVHKGKEWLESPAHHGTELQPNVCPCGVSRPKWASSKHDQSMQSWIHANKVENFDKLPDNMKDNIKEKKRKETEMLEPQRHTSIEKGGDDSALIIEGDLVPMSEPVKDRYTKSEKPEERSFLCNKCNNPINYSQFTRTRATGGIGLCSSCENKPDEHLSGGFIP